MKTQLLTLIIILTVAMNAFAANKNNSTAPDHEAMNDLSWINEVTAEESLSIESWMTDDKSWESNAVISNLNDVTVEDELQIEPWMTNSALWKVKSNMTTVTIKGINYRAFRIKNTKEEPLRIEAWMTNDKLWRL